MNNHQTLSADPSSSPERLRELLDDISREATLPPGRTELTLLDVDPHRAHVYWNIESADASPDRSLVLRVYDITDATGIDSAGQVFDVNLQGAQGHWYLDFWRDDRTFVADIGYIKVDGSLDLLARSNEVRTPPAPPLLVTEPVDSDGLVVQTELPKHAPVEATPEPEAPGTVEPIELLREEFPLAGAMEDQHASAKEDTPVRAAGESSVAFVEADEVEDALPQEFPAADLLKDLVLENQPAVEAYYRAVEALPAPPAPAPEKSKPSNATPSVTTPRVELEHIIGLSSLARARKDPDLEVHVELRIYGRTRPHRELSLYGQTIKSGPDGAFFIVRTLPDGHVMLPFKGD